MIFPLLGLENPKRETNVCHGAREAQRKHGLFLSFSAPQWLRGNRFFDFPSSGILSAYPKPQ